jgi:uncharacterized protein (TIGR04255 family)
MTSSVAEHLPDYDNPPVVETVLGIQYEKLPNFKNAHLGMFWSSFNLQDWPRTVDVVATPPQIETYAEGTRWGKGFQFQIMDAPASRMQIKNANNDRMIQVQNNRLHFNWLGKSGGDYPRYAAVRTGFDDVLQRFIRFVAENDLGEFRPNQWEVTYINHIPQGTVWGTPADWGFFKPLGNVPSIPGIIDSESFQGEWHFLIPERKGRLHIQWQHGTRLREDKPDYVQLTLTARGGIELAKDPLEAVGRGLDLGHDVIVRSFERLMSDDANQYWRLKHARNVK